MERKENRCSRVGRRTRDKVLENDVFAEKFEFRLPEGKETFYTVKGCLSTVILLMALVFYGTIRFVKLQTYDDTDIMVSSWDSFYKPSYVHTDNLMFAFGLTVYDSNPEPVEDPSIGVLKPYYKSWGIKDTGGVDFEELPTRNCT